MKVLAMYLPQFHRVPENDSWWGEGYTEWTAVKKARPFFREHQQPRVPLDDNYYDLTEKETMVWQADLMRKYGVDGLCIYHYWFKDGRRILEKPAENLLKWRDIDMPYCFCWANETWARTWANVPSANYWDKMNEKKDESDGVLLIQDYGEIEQWKEHFNYLLPFFKDDRYIKVDGKPILYIYRGKDIQCLGEMINYWRELAINCGLTGLFVLASECWECQNKYVDGIVANEPNASVSELQKEYPQEKGYRRYTYDQLWSKILINAYENDKIYYHGVVSEDETPRQGETAVIIYEDHPKKFGFYLRKLLKRSHDTHKALLFLNAWNEWGEGMYLEPDDRFGYGYLEELKSARDSILDIDYNFDTLFEELLLSKINGLKTTASRINDNLMVFNQWINLYQKNISICSLLKNEGINRIAIYGFGVVGRRLYEELKETDIQIDYVVEKKKIFYGGIVFIKPEDEYKETDVVIVTPALESAKIAQDINNRTSIRTMTMKELFDLNRRENID